MSGHHAVLGEHCTIQDSVVLGLKYREECDPVKIGNRAVIRSFSVIYGDVVIGDDFKTGHGVMIREKTRIGNRVLVGTHAVIDGQVEIGDFVKIESQVYIPTHAKIGSHVFIGPGAVLTNDRYPQRKRDEYVPEGPVLENGVTLGANVTVLPGVRIGEGSFIAAGAVVTADIPAWSLVKGVPGRIELLPEGLRELNHAKKW